MAERRTMTDAFSLTPEKVAFIQRGSQEKKIVPQAEVRSTANRSDSASFGSNASRVETTSHELSTTAKPAQTFSEAASSEQTADARPLIGQHLVALTTRLHARTAEALRRAYLEQKLRQVSPSTQQELVQLAVDQWLERNGYLS